MFGLTSNKRFPQEATKNHSYPRREGKMRLRLAKMIPESGEFNHYRPAEYLTEQGLKIELPGIDKALDRFEQLFKDLNALLPPRK